MALDGTYIGLQASIADWMVRTDLSSQIVDFITLGEEMLNKECRFRCMQVAGSIVASSTPVALPDDYLEARSFIHTVVPFRPVTLVPEQWADEHSYAWAYYTNPPPHYTIEGQNFRLVTRNAGSWTVTANYYQKLNLASGTTNAVLVKYPSLYLFSALMASVPFLGDDGRGASWQAAYEMQKSLAIADDARAKWSGSTLVQRTRRAP